MNYADKTKYPQTAACGKIQDVNKMGSRKPMKLNLGMAPKVILIMLLDVLATAVSFFWDCGSGMIFPLPKFAPSIWTVFCPPSAPGA